MNRIGLQRGLSLIELMVAIVLASLLLLGVLQVFDGNQRTHRLQQGFSQIQESGRIATDMLMKELRNVAFTGCVLEPQRLSNSAAAIFDSNFVSGVDQVDGSQPQIDNKSVEPGTDILTVRGAVDACGGTGRIVANVDASTVQIAGSCPLEVDDVAMVANCDYGDISTVAAASATQVRLSDSLQADYGPEARLYRPYVRRYFISRDADNELGLYMQEDGDDAMELVPGIEDLQVQYGRDSGGVDGIVDIWDGPPANDNESSAVAAIRVQLVAASTERNGADRFSYTRLGEDSEHDATDDGRLRKQYVSMTKVRNRGTR
ncbi:PilW family protein [Microbulbifer litoralis]|uniref:PilW family protein n=1 Tax=Microbulbifer litoralis TaxID=2933965 RepID=UPI0020289004|nr:PilW family protein [Microbulbifer sp. GX H0434]